MYTLYGSPGSGSASVEAALAESGAQFEFVRIRTSNGDHLTADFTAINPRQQIPALVIEDGSAMTEGVAIMLYLADANPASGLAPKPGTTERAQHDRWLVFMAINIYEGELRKGYSDRYSSDPNGAAGVAEAADLYVKRHWLLLEEAIKTGPYFFGEQLTMVDLYLWMLANWMDAEWLKAHCPKIETLRQTIGARPKMASITAANFG